MSELYRCSACGERVRRDQIRPDGRCTTHPDAGLVRWRRRLGYAFAYITDYGAKHGPAAVDAFAREFDHNYYPGVTVADMIEAARYWHRWGEDVLPELRRELQQQRVYLSMFTKPRSR